MTMFLRPNEMISASKFLRVKNSFPALEKYLGSPFSSMIQIQRHPSNLRLTYQLSLLKLTFLAIFSSKELAKATSKVGISPGITLLIMEAVDLVFKFLSMMLKMSSSCLLFAATKPFTALIALWPVRYLEFKSFNMSNKEE